MFRKLGRWVSLILIFLLSCRTASERSEVSQTEVEPRELQLCAAVRGNGPRIFAHFGALARVVEDIGMPSGIGGSSSASITAFLYESIRLNPHTRQCGPEPCSEAQQRNRVALLLKSIEAFIGLAKNAVENEAPLLESFNYFSQRLATLKTALPDSQDLEKVEQFLDSISTSKLKEVLGPLANPEFLQFAANPYVDVTFRMKAVRAAIEDFGKFDATDPQILFRPGLFNFQVFAQNIGRIGSFLAGYPVGGSNPQVAQANQAKINAMWVDYFAQCAANQEGQIWQTFGANRDTREVISSSCRQQFEDLVTSFFDLPEGPNRANDKMGLDHLGQPSQIFTLVGTSMSRDETTLRKFRNLRSQYLTGQLSNNQADYFLEPGESQAVFDFDIIEFGLWSSHEQALANIESSIHSGSTNTQLRKFHSLGTQVWQEPLSLSPAEPGLTNAQPFRQGTHLSFGGWSFLFPVTEFLATNTTESRFCDQVVYLTRKATARDDLKGSGEPGDKGFARGVASLLGMPDGVDNELYTLADDVPSSAFRRAITSADFVSCTHWDDADLTQQSGFNDLILEGYSAPILDKTIEPFFETPGCTEK